MPFIPREKPLTWTQHAKAKMGFYKLSPARVRHVLHTPKRTEEGVTPKTVAMMQPASLKTTFAKHGLSQKNLGRFVARAGTLGPASAESAVSRAKKETWSQEIWVMVQDTPKERRVISAWRYPGMTKPRSEIAINLMQREYDEFMSEKEGSAKMP